MNIDTLYQEVEKILQDYRKRAPIRDKSKYIRAREGGAFFDGKFRNKLMMLLATRGCKWYLESGGCFMCSYNVSEPLKEFSAEEIINQIKKITKKYGLKDKEVVYIYPYSSFDTKEMPEKARMFIYNLLNQYKNIKHVVFQSRPEFITEEILKEVKENLPEKKCYVEVGLETSNDFIRKYCIHKGFEFEKVKEKVKLIKDYGLHPVAFILFKPPFLTEKESIEDVISSIKDSFKIGVESVILMCNNIGEYSITELLYNMKKYRVLWLWSTIEVLKNFNESDLNRIKVSGFKIGSVALEYPFNCKICNEKFMKAIEEFNKGRNFSVFEGLDCKCKNEWRKELKRKYPPLKDRIIEDYKELISFYKK